VRVQLQGTPGYGKELQGGEKCGGDTMLMSWVVGALA
jgi:hypothetical protein